MDQSTERPKSARMRVSECEHKEFHAVVVVRRIEDIKRFMAEIRIRCQDCGLPFEFMGMGCGLSFDEPMLDPTAQEARLPIKPKGTNALPGIPGFKVRLM